VRISTENLGKNRRARNSHILISGGTGFLGSHIAARLLDAGFKITILARTSRETDADERVRRIMDWHGISNNARKRLRVVPWDLLDRDIGMGLDERIRLQAEADEIIHCASETSFAERKRAQVENVNLGGIEKMLDFAAAGRCHSFHYLSTAYVAGRQTGMCPESLSTAREFHNVYEETKCSAEKIVWKRCCEKGIRSVLYRPSIVYGHSITGRSLLFNALYYPVRAAVFLRDIYMRDIYEQGGKRAQAAGVKISPDGNILHFPLRVKADGPGIDLIPVDFFTEAFAAIFETALESGIYHIVNGGPTPVAAIAEFTARMFRLNGVEVMSADLYGKPRNLIEATFNQMIDVYNPYMSDLRTFSTDRSSLILQRVGLSCPPLSYEMFQRCMNYAVAVGWRAKALEDNTLPNSGTPPGNLSRPVP
jgi:nucleoside-diphosphate-sugar epimerase